MASLLITGGAGFIGSHLVEAALAAGHRVTVLDDLSTGRRANLAAAAEAGDRFRLIEGDIRRAADVDRAIAAAGEGAGGNAPAALFHLAAMISVPESMADPARCEELNVGGTECVAARAAAHGVGRLVFASSAAVYGHREPPLNEPMATSDSAYVAALPSPYAASKLRGEAVVAAAGVPAYSFRFFNVYGARQPASGGYPAVIPAFLDGIYRTGRVTLYGDGKQTRDFVHVADVVAGLLLALGPGASGVYNLGSGRVHSLNELLAVLRAVTGRDFAIDREPPRPGDIRHSHCAIDRARVELGFAPRVDLPAGLARTAPAFRAAAGAGPAEGGA